MVNVLEEVKGFSENAVKMLKVLNQIFERDSLEKEKNAILKL